MRSRMRSQRFERLRKLILLTMFGVLMFISQLVMAILPNIHMIAVFITVFTVIYRKWALVSIYVYVFLNGSYCGFSQWWWAYVYVWAILWLVIILVPKKLNLKIAVPIYTAICALHGLSFGALCAPSQAIAFGFSFEQTLAWIASGLPYDLIHCFGNIVMSVLIYPLLILLKKLEAKKQTV